MRKLLQVLIFGGYVGVVILVVLIVSIWLNCTPNEISIYGYASWYGETECRKINPSLLMANGKRYRENEFTCAIWDMPFGTRLRVTNLDNKKSVITVVQDRGPNKRLVKQGRVIDLSRASFDAIGNLDEGLIKVRVDIIEDSK